MRKIKEILSDLGFYDIPDSVKEPLTESFDLWKGLINFDEALNFYGLCDNSYFMELFKPALNLFYKNPEMQYAVYFLNEYLFDTKKYNWDAILIEMNKICSRQLFCYRDIKNIS